MKLQNLFEASPARTREQPLPRTKLDYLSEDDRKIFEWLLIEGFRFGTDRLSNSFKRSTLSPIEWYQKNHSEVYDAFNGYYDDFVISNGVVSHKDTVYFGQLDKAPPPPPTFKLGKVGGLEISRNCKSVTELPHWLPSHTGFLKFVQTGITSIKGLNKIVKECESITFLDKPYGPRRRGQDMKVPLGILTVFKIRGLVKISISGTAGKKACGIINNRLTGDRDVLECQNELIDAGFEESATL